MLSVQMPVLPATDIVVTKLMALDEHYCDFARLLPVARALREQVDWADGAARGGRQRLRRRSSSSCSTGSTGAADVSGSVTTSDPTAATATSTTATVTAATQPRRRDIGSPAARRLPHLRGTRTGASPPSTPAPSSAAAPAATSSDGRLGARTARCAEQAGDREHARARSAARPGRCACRLGLGGASPGRAPRPRPGRRRPPRRRRPRRPAPRAAGSPAGRGRRGSPSSLARQRR